VSRHLRRALDLASIPRDWLAYWLVILLPSHWRWVEPTWFALLPYAGGWAYRYDPWAVECRTHWIATGRQKP
jgi:hypothetical protein